MKLFVFIKKYRCLYLFTFLITGLFYFSCDNFTEHTYNSAEFTYFGFDSFPAIEDYEFYINNFNNTIYNTDSFPFLSEVDTIYPTITVVSTNGDIYVNDSTLWDTEEIIDFSAGNITMTNTSEDGNYTKKYTISINIHQVDPDSIRMNILSNNFPEDAIQHKTIATDDGFMSFFKTDDNIITSYFSTEGKTWDFTGNLSGLGTSTDIASLTKLGSFYYLVSDSCLYSSSDLLEWSKAIDSLSIITLLGHLNARKYLRSEVLAGISCNTSGDLYFGQFQEGTWTSGESVPEDFPVKDFASTEYETSTEVPYLTVATGRNAAGDLSTHIWSTMNGLHWAKIADIQDSISPREGASIFYYNDSLYLYGGQSEDGSLDATLYISDDEGLNWKEAPSAAQFKNIEKGLVYQQILTGDTYIRIFGGKDGSNLHNKVWKGYVNKVMFAKE